MPLVWFPAPQYFRNTTYTKMMSGDLSSRTEVLSYLQEYFKGLLNVFTNPPGYQTQYSCCTYTWIYHDAEPSWYVNRAHKVFYKVMKPLIDAIPSPNMFDDKFISEIDTDFYKYWKRHN